MYPPEDDKIDLEMEIYNRVILCAPKHHQRDFVKSPLQGVGVCYKARHQPPDLKVDVKPFLPMNDSIEVKLELGHKAILKKGYNPEGYTHDWKLFVRGPEGCNIQHFIEKVVFHLHSTFPRPKRVLKEPPYEVQECGYAGFHVPIDIYFKNKNEPKKLQFMYDLFLRVDEQVNHIRCEKLTFQNPTDDFRKRLLLSGGSIKSAEATKDGSVKKSPVQVALQTTPKAAAAANTPEFKAFTELFGPPDIAKKPKKKSSEKEKSLTPKSSKTESISNSTKPDISPAPGSSNHGNKVIDLTTEKTHQSSQSSSKHKQSDRPRSSSSHKESKHRHGSESKSSSKVQSDKSSESQDRLHPSSAEKKAAHERRSGSHEKGSSSNHDNRTESAEKHSKSQDKSYSSSDRRSGSHEKHSHGSHDKKTGSHDKHRSSENRLSSSQDKYSSSSEKSSHSKQSQEVKPSSHEKNTLNKTPSHSAHGTAEKSHSASLSKSSSKRPAEETSTAKEDYNMLKKKKKKDKEKDRDYVKEVKAPEKGSSDREKTDKKERSEEKKSSSRSDKERSKSEKGEESRGEKVNKQKDKEERQTEKTVEKPHKYERHKSVETKDRDKERKDEKRHKSERKEEKSQPEKHGTSKKEPEYKRQSSTKEGSSGKDKKKSRSKEDGHDGVTEVNSSKGRKEDIVVTKKAEQEPKVVKDEKKSGKKRKKGTEDLDSALSDSDISFVDEDLVGKKKKKKHSHRSKSYSSSQTKKKSISEIYTDSDEEGEIKDDSFTVKNKSESPSAKVKVKSEERGGSSEVKAKAKKRSSEEGFLKESKSRKAVMRDLFSSSDDESQQEQEHEEVEEEMDMKEEQEGEVSDVVEEDGEYLSASQSDSEDDTHLSDVQIEEETSRKDMPKSYSGRQPEKADKSTEKPKPIAKDSRSLFSNDIFSTGELSDDDPFGDNLSQNNDETQPEGSNSFKENTKPLDKLLSEIDTGSESSMDDDDILSPMEHTDPLFSPRKPPPPHPHNTSKSSPRTHSTPSHHTQTKSPRAGSAQRPSEVKSEPLPVSGRSSGVVEKHRSPAARGGKGPDSHNALQMAKNDENLEKSRQEVQKQPVQSNRREKGSIIANKSPKVPSDVSVKPVSDIEDDLAEESDSDNESVSSASSSSAESGENSDSDESEENPEEPEVEQGEVSEMQTEVKENLQKEPKAQGMWTEVKKEPERLKSGSFRDGDASRVSQASVATGSPHKKDKGRSKGEFMKDVSVAEGDNNQMRRSDTGMFGECTNDSESQQLQVRSAEKASNYGSKRKPSPGSINNGPTNVARVEPLPRERTDTNERNKESSSSKKSTGSSLPTGMAAAGVGGGDSKNNTVNKDSGGSSASEDLCSRKAPNGEYLGSLLDLQKKLYSIMSNSELLNNIVKIIMKDETFYSITDTTFDFDLCRLDKNTLNKIQGFLQTTK